MVFDIRKRLTKGHTTAGEHKVFVSTTQTGTGAQQSIAHGLGVTPTVVVVMHLSSDPWDVQGTHTSTNVLITVSSDASYKVVAWKP